MEPAALLYPLLSISRLRMAIDGEGVTTLIAGAGCPLNCRWCINRKLLKEAKPHAVTAEELIDRVKIDDLYFRATGGGVTFGGGEALLHADFIRHFRETCPDGWRITVETSLSVMKEAVLTALEAVDDYIVDCKDMDPVIYKSYTGGDASLMKENLTLLLNRIGPDRITVRVPLIPEFNTKASRSHSISELQAMGITKLDLFSYVIRE